MRGHMIAAEALRQLAGHALDQAARIDKDQSGAVLLDQLGQAVVELLPDLPRHHRFERRGGNFEREVAGPAMAGVDDRYPSFSLSPRRPGGEGRGEGGRGPGSSAAHLTLPSPRDGPLPLPPEGRRGAVLAGSDEKARDSLDRLLGGRQADA